MALRWANHILSISFRHLLIVLIERTHKVLLCLFPSQSPACTFNDVPIRSFDDGTGT